MRDRYDFSKAKRGPVVKTPTGKERITIRLDSDIIEWFRNRVERAGGGNYQTLMNNALREYTETRKAKLAALMRRVVREELDRRSNATPQEATLAERRRP